MTASDHGEDSSSKNIERSNKVRHVIERELLGPTPRKVRLKSQSLASIAQTESARATLAVMSQFRPYLGLIFIIPMLAGLRFLYDLVLALVEVSRGQRRLVDITFLIVVTFVWNLMAWTGIWNAVVVPFMLRRLVINGTAVLGKVTEISTSERHCRIYYEFFDLSFPYKGFITIPKREWDESLRPGDSLTVLYSQRNPNWSTPYRCSQYEVIPNE